MPRYSTKGQQTIIKADPGELCESCTKSFDGKDYCTLFVTHGLKKDFVETCEEYDGNEEIPETHDHTPGEEMVDLGEMANACATIALGVTKGAFYTSTGVFMFLWGCLMVIVAIPVGILFVCFMGALIKAAFS